MNFQSAYRWYCRHLNLIMLLAILAGALIGFVTPTLAGNLEIFGDLFLRALKLLILPVIVLSILCGVLQLEDASQLGNLGIRTFLFYMFTTAIAVITGLALVNMTRPGLNPESPGTASAAIVSREAPPAQKASGLTEVLKNIIPTNLAKAAVDGNVLGLICFSLFLGIALLYGNPTTVLPLRQGISALFDATIWMVDRVMLFAPPGILGLIAPLVAQTVLEQKLGSLGYELQIYAFTVVGGLLLHGAFTLPLLLYLAGINPFAFFRAMLPALSTAFSTASSSATLPLTIDSLKRRAGVPDKYASFVAPLGATVNMDGTAIYESIAVVFIANMYGVDLSFPEQCVVFLTATFSAIGAAGIPGAGLIMMTMILQAVGLPAEGISLVVVVDRLLDMIRTAVNVWGDSIGAALLARLAGDFERVAPAT